MASSIFFLKSLLPPFERWTVNSGTCKQCIKLLWRNCTSIYCKKHTAVSREAAQAGVVYKMSINRLVTFSTCLWLFWIQADYSCHFSFTEHRAAFQTHMWRVKIIRLFLWHRTFSLYHNFFNLLHLAAAHRDGESVVGYCSVSVIPGPNLFKFSHNQTQLDDRS